MAVAEPFYTKNKQVFGIEYIEQCARGGQNLSEQNKELLETRTSHIEMIFFALLCCKSIYSYKFSVRFNIRLLSGASDRNKTQIGLRKK